jgi:hypothetical protein
VDKS